MYAFREIYGLNGWIKDLQKDFSRIENVEIYAFPFDVSFIEIYATSKNEMKRIDEQCISKIIKYCEEQAIEDHLIAPLTEF